VTTAQVLFAIALGSITVLITVFALYVVSSTMWGNRWFRAGPGREERSEGKP